MPRLMYSVIPQTSSTAFWAIQLSWRTAYAFFLVASPSCSRCFIASMSACVCSSPGWMNFPCAFVVSRLRVSVSRSRSFFIFECVLIVCFGLFGVCCVYVWCCRNKQFLHIL